MNRVIFQPDRTQLIPIFHHSIIPMVSVANYVQS